METLEERVRELESQMRHLLDREAQPERAARWEKIIGTFADSEGFEEAARLGREYRQSLRPVGDQDSA